ncbi:MAG: acyl dehydratase [Deltaproteobacteria bacterium]|nr:acyl dehydratase [Deltaproteobacteria bacterium]
MHPNYPLIYWEDISLNDEFLSLSRTITEADIANMAGLLGWYDPLHTDEEYCKGTLFGKRVAQGLLGLNLSNGLMRGCIDHPGGLVAIAAFLEIQWKFLKPMFIGDTIFIRMRVQEKKETKHPDRGIVVFGCEVIRENGETLQKGRKTYLIHRKP